MPYILTVIGVIVLYLGWNISLTSWSRLLELGVEHKKNSYVFFDTVLWSFLIALMLSRLVWMTFHISLYSDVPWGILPYVRTTSSIDWLTYFPWRILRFTEGLQYQVLWATFGLISAITIYIPTISLARKLKVEKSSVTIGFVMKALAGLIITLAYFAALILFSM